MGQDLLDLFFRIFWLLIVEVIALYLATGLDYCGKHKDYSKVIRKKMNILFIRSNYERENFIVKKGCPISKQSFIFQIFNGIYVLVYFIVAVIDVYFFRNIILWPINLISLVVYGGICIVSIVGLVLSPHSY